MTLREKIGQRLIVGVPGTELTKDDIRFLEDYKIGNIILFERNIHDNAQLRRLCDELQEIITRSTGHRAFITLDQEGGNTARLADDGVNVPAAMALAATGDPENAYLAGRATGRELRRLGPNVNLAPVMDVNCNPGNPIICERSYSDRPETVTKYALEMMRGLVEEGVLACAKHFPGHGDTDVDSHLNMPTVGKSLAEMEKTELLPFRAAIRAGVPAIMSAHIMFPALEPEPVPATVSKRILTGFLREKLGYEGLILSDCLEMDAILGVYGVTEGGIRAMEAGADMVFVSHTARLAMEAVEAMEKKAEAETEFAANIDRAVERILKYKKIYAKDTPFAPADMEAKARIEKIYEETMTAVRLPQGQLPQLGDHPLFVGCPLFCATGVENVEGRAEPFAWEMARLLGGEAVVLSPEFGECEIAQAAERAQRCSSVVVGIYHADQRPNQLCLIRRLAQAEVPVIAISMKSPYELAGLPDHVASLMAWEYTERAFAAAAKVLAGKTALTGKLPVALPQELPEEACRNI